MVNLDAFVLKDLEKLFVSIFDLTQIISEHIFPQLTLTVKVSRSSDFLCDDVLFNHKVDCCQISEGLLNSLYMKVFMGEIIKSASFKFECPFRAGPYIIRNLTTPDIPKMPLPNNIYICMTQKYVGKLYGSKKPIPVGTVKAFFSFLKG